MTLVLVGTVLLAGSEPSWTEADGDYLLPSIKIRLDQTSSHVELVPKPPAERLVIDFYLPVPGADNSDVMEEMWLEKLIPGNDADVHIELRDSENQIITSEGAVFQRWGWGGTVGASELRASRGFPITSFVPPFSLSVTVHTPSSEPAQVRVQVRASDVRLSGAPPNKALQLTGHASIHRAW